MPAGLCTLADFKLPFQMGGFDTQDLGLPGLDAREVGPAWVSSPDNDMVWELDAIGHRVVRKIPVGRRPTGVDLDESNNAVWVVNSGDGTVSRIDATTGEVVATIEVGGSPQSIAVGEGGVWVTVYPTTTAPASNEASAPDTLGGSLTGNLG